MKHEMIFAGFGGQGVLSMGMTLASAALLEGKEVTWMPSYGPEMRGGTANCIVIIADNKVSSPIITRFDTAVVLNQPSIDKFESRIYPGGLMIYDLSTTVTPPTREDITLVPLAVDNVMKELGNPKVRNMVMLGALLSLRPIVQYKTIIDALAEVLPERYHHLLDVNYRALELSGQLVAEAVNSHA